MTENKELDLDGQQAYLRPGNPAWQPLTEDALEAIFAVNAPVEDTPDARKKCLADSKQSLSDALSGGLQLPNLALFAGSGTSLGEVGGPSMWDLWRRCMWESPEVPDGHDDFGVLKDQASAVCEQVKYDIGDSPNIEHFLSQCEAYLGFNDDGAVSKFLIEVKSIILGECSSFIEGGNCDLSSYQTILQRLARRRVRDPRLKIFTTNYDLCFEVSSAQLGMVLVDGFSYTQESIFDGRYFDYDFVKRESDSHEFVEGVFQLYKLHGSVSWERRDGSVYQSVNPKAEDAALIYPAKGKYQQSFVQPHLELFSRYIESLRKPNSCILVAGFGFNDDHLSEPIISAIKSNPGLRLIVADRNACSNISRSRSGEAVSPYWAELADLSGKGFDIHVLNLSFSELANTIPNLRALSPAERLSKEVRMAGRHHGNS